jgi:hypothetical protein
VASKKHFALRGVRCIFVMLLRLTARGRNSTVAGRLGVIPNKQSRIDRNRRAIEETRLREDAIAACESRMTQARLHCTTEIFRRSLEPRSASHFDDDFLNAG